MVAERSVPEEVAATTMFSTAWCWCQREKQHWMDIPLCICSMNTCQSLARRWDARPIDYSREMCSRLAPSGVSVESRHKSESPTSPTFLASERHPIGEEPITP